MSSYGLQSALNGAGEMVDQFTTGPEVPVGYHLINLLGQVSLYSSEQFSTAGALSTYTRLNEEHTEKYGLQMTHAYRLEDDGIAIMKWESPANNYLSSDNGVGDFVLRITYDSIQHLFEFRDYPTALVVGSIHDDYRSYIVLQALSAAELQDLNQAIIRAKRPGDVPAPLPHSGVLGWQNTRFDVSCVGYQKLTPEDMTQIEEDPSTIANYFEKNKKKITKHKLKLADDFFVVTKHKIDRVKLNDVKRMEEIEDPDGNRYLAMFIDTKGKKNSIVTFILILLFDYRTEQETFVDWLNRGGKPHDDQYLISKDDSLPPKWSGKAFGDFAVTPISENDPTFTKEEMVPIDLLSLHRAYKEEIESYNSRAFMYNLFYYYDEVPNKHYGSAYLGRTNKGYGIDSKPGELNSKLQPWQRIRYKAIIQCEYFEDLKACVVKVSTDRNVPPPVENTKKKSKKEKKDKNAFRPGDNYYQIFKFKTSEDAEMFVTQASRNHPAGGLDILYYKGVARPVEEDDDNEMEQNDRSNYDGAMGSRPESRDQSRHESPERDNEVQVTTVRSTQQYGAAPGSYHDESPRRSESPDIRMGAAPIPVPVPVSSSRDSWRDRHSPDRRDNSWTRRDSPDRRRDSPDRRRDSPERRRDSPDRRRGSPERRRGSPDRRRNSPEHRRGSPEYRYNGGSTSWQNGSTRRHESPSPDRRHDSQRGRHSDRRDSRDSSPRMKPMSRHQSIKMSTIERDRAVSRASMNGGYTSQIEIVELPDTDPDEACVLGSAYMFSESYPTVRGGKSTSKNHSKRGGFPSYDPNDSDVNYSD